MESRCGSLGVTRPTNHLKLLLIFSSSCLLDIGYGRIELVARERRHHVDPVVVVIVIGGRLSFVIVLPHHLRKSTCTSAVDVHVLLYSYVYTTKHNYLKDLYSCSVDYQFHKQ